jgi:ankyrin repeat protein
MGLFDFFKKQNSSSPVATNSSDNMSSTTGAAQPRTTELAVACEAGDFDRAIQLLRDGANPNEVSSDGRTPLFYCKEVALVSLLIHFGADVNATDLEGNTPLMEILKGENVNSNGERAVIVLIESGADVGVRNKQGLSARDIAASRKAAPSEFEQYMLDSGVDVEIESHDEMYAALEQGLSVVANKKRAFDGKLQQQGMKRAAWREEMNPLADGDFNTVTMNCFLACTLNDIEVLKAHEETVREYINMRMKVGDMQQRSMLMSACVDSSAEIVEYLLSLGADVNQVDDSGQAPLRYAAVSWIDIERKIRLLLDAGADVNHRGNDGSAALSDAAFYQNDTAAKVLLANGADVNNRDSQGYTAISWTCGKGAPEGDIVELLLRYGADVRDLYAMNCVLQYSDYYTAYGRTLSREVTLRPQDLTERHLYEHSLIPARLTNSGRARLEAQGFSF